MEKVNLKKTGMQASKTEIFNELTNFLSKKVSSNANIIDQNNRIMLDLFIEFKDRKFFSIYVPAKYGGVDLTQKEKIDIQEMMGYHGGALSFLQAQTGIASWLLQMGDNLLLREEILTYIIQGEMTVGNCTFQMKHNHREKLVGVMTQDGYLINGNLAFVSGFKFFDQIVIGFHSGQHEVFALIPFHTRSSLNFSVSEIFSTVTMKSMNTVEINFKNYFIPEDHIIAKWPQGYFFSQYRKFPPYAYPIGIANKALAITKDSTILKMEKSLKEKHNLLNKKMRDLKIKLYFTSNEKSNSVTNHDRLFSQIIQNSWSALQFGILISGGAGLLSTHTMQRLYRELLIWYIPRAYPQVIADVFYNLSGEIL